MEPIACSLSGDAYAARIDSLSRLGRGFLLSREPIHGGARLTFARDAEAEIREAIAAEAECCPFLKFDLVAVDRSVRVEVTGPADAQPMIAELFAAA